MDAADRAEGKGTRSGTFNLVTNLKKNLPFQNMEELGQIRVKVAIRTRLTGLQNPFLHSDKTTRARGPCQARPEASSNARFTATRASCTL